MEILNIEATAYCNVYQKRLHISKAKIKVSCPVLFFEHFYPTSWPKTGLTFSQTGDFSMNLAELTKRWNKITSLWVKKLAPIAPKLSNFGKKAQLQKLAICGKQ